jgi:hypothetical protein
MSFIEPFYGAAVRSGGVDSDPVHSDRGPDSIQDDALETEADESIGQVAAVLILQSFPEVRATPRVGLKDHG